MKRLFWVSGLVLLMAGPALAEAVYYPPQVTGKRERKNIRHFLYVQNLAADKKAVYDEYGYTPHRVRLNQYGRIEERWTYYEQGLVFVFDQCDRLRETHRINPEHRRDWAYQREAGGYAEDIPGCDD